MHRPILRRMASTALATTLRAKIRVWCPRGPECAGGFTLKAGGRTIGKGSFLVRSRANRVVLARHRKLRVVARTDGGRVSRLTLT